MSYNSNKQLTHKQKLAIEVMAVSPKFNQKELAKELGVCNKTIVNWLNDPTVIDAIYKRYMEVAGIKLPAVITAMIREAEEGNVQAGRLVLEHFGKLDNRVKVQVVSPFEKFLKYDLTEEIEDAEFIENDEVIDDLKLISSQYHDIVGKDIDLPNRNPVNNNPGVRKHDEQRRNALSTQYEKKKLEKVQIQKNMYQRRKRAKEVGLELLPRGRQTQSVRNKWWDELERLELIKFGEIRGERF
jgi:DNA-binding XRE family transcriptional regulator